MKWNSFVKKEFFTQLYTFVVYFFLAAACFILRPTLPAEEEEECSGEEGLGSDGANSSLSEDDTATPTVDYTMLLTTLEAMDFGVSPSPIRWFGIGKEGVGRGASKLAFDWSKSDESEASYFYYPTLYTAMSFLFLHQRRCEGAVHRVPQQPDQDEGW